MRTIGEKSVFVCQECGHESLRWMGKCPGCGQWNTLVEEAKVTAAPARRTAPSRGEKPRSITEVETADTARMKTGIGEFDRILGGGVVPGSVVLIGGDPGVGKSTLLLQVADRIARKGGKVLYVSGEESNLQMGLRARRLGAAASALYLVSETNLDVIVDHIKKLRPEVVVIDSIQIVYRPALSSAPGSISQVRECAGELTLLAKSSGISFFFVGHVTKEGFLAGPRVLEHLVDTVVYFEGEKRTAFRILRVVKNRFGSTNEVGIFEMSTNGLKEVINPSHMFLTERGRGVSGSMVVPCLEGNRPLLVEVQALVSQGNPGMPRRRSAGLEPNRIAMLLAVLEKRVALRLRDQDVFVNVAGGMRITETAADLAAALAIVSSRRNLSVKPGDIALGEVSLSGEIREVSRTELRLAEAHRLGFTRVITARNVSEKFSFAKDGIRIVGVSTLAEAVKTAFS